MPILIDLLKQAYAAELETVANYLALSEHLDGVHAHPIREELGGDVDDELGHARRLAKRIKDLGAMPPGSLALDFHQSFLQPPEDSTDIRPVVEGVIAAENEAIRVYREIVDAARGAEDFATEHLAADILEDEEHHRTVFAGFLKEMDRHEEAHEARQARPEPRARH